MNKWSILHETNNQYYKQNQPESPYPDHKQKCPSDKRPASFPSYSLSKPHEQVSIGIYIHALSAACIISMQVYDGLFFKRTF